MSTTTPSSEDNITLKRKREETQGDGIDKSQELNVCAVYGNNEEIVNFKMKVKRPRIEENEEDCVKDKNTNTSNYHYFIFCLTDADYTYEMILHCLRKENCVDDISCDVNDLVKFINTVNEEEDDLMRRVYWEAIWHFITEDIFNNPANKIVDQQMKKRLSVHDDFSTLFLPLFRQFRWKDIETLVKQNAMMVHMIQLKQGDNEWCC